MSLLRRFVCCVCMYVLCCSRMRVCFFIACCLCVTRLFLCLCLWHCLCSCLCLCLCRDCGARLAAAVAAAADGDHAGALAACCVLCSRMRAICVCMRACLPLSSCAIAELALCFVCDFVCIICSVCYYHTLFAFSCSRFACFVIAFLLPL